MLESFTPIRRDIRFNVFNPVAYASRRVFVIFINIRTVKMAIFAGDREVST